MLAALLLAVASATTAPAVSRVAGRRAGLLLALAPAAIFAWLCTQYPTITSGGVIRESWPWVPALDVGLRFRLDGLSLLFALLVSGMGVVVLVYASAYLQGDDRQPRFYVVILAFMASMLGLVLADDLVLLFVFWELTSLTSYLLVGYDHESPAARAAALQALLVTAGGGLALLAGVLMLGSAAGTFEIGALTDGSRQLTAHPLYLPVLCLVAVGAFTKSAQTPFHFWLPGAMVAPSPVSAYLHSATMVKAGLYLLARLAPALGGTDAWHNLITVPGAATMLIGAFMALGQDDLKRMLAYTTISGLGTITLLIGIDTVQSTKAAIVFLVVHALYKGALFLVAGSLDHEAGSRHLSRLGGLARMMPLTAATAVLAALSMAGLPPLFGFVAKELLYEAKVAAPTAAGFITAAGVTANVFMVALAALVAVRPFFGTQRAPGHPHDPPPAMWAGPLVLSLGGLVLGVFPVSLAEPLVGAAVSAVRAEETEVALALWHGFNPIVALSITTVVLGVFAFVVRDPLLPGAAVLSPLGRFGPARWYAASLRALVRFAEAQTRLLQNGRLSSYVRTTVLTFVLVTVWALAWNAVPVRASFGVPRAHEIVLAGLIVLGALVAVRIGSRLAAVAALAVVGFGIALAFLVWSAPDLALTQFAVETLSIILFVFVLYRLPRMALFSSLHTRTVDALVAASAGAVITVLTWAVTADPHGSALRDFFADESVPGGKGRNVVNVILVDFRAFDTLGEITVLATAALGVYALLRLLPEEEPR